MNINIFSESARSNINNYFIKYLINYSDEHVSINRDYLSFFNSLFFNN
jgi:hypothetical protein